MVVKMRYEDIYIPAGTTTQPSIERVSDILEKFKSELVESDFGLKINGINIFYFLYLKDKLSCKRGRSIMLGSKTVFQYDWGNAD